jgi:hypothetical protein
MLTGNLKNSRTRTAQRKENRLKAAIAGTKAKAALPKVTVKNLITG